MHEQHSAKQLEGQLQALFPDNVAVSCLLTPPAEEPLLPAELQATTNMVPRRRAEFAQGRACARTAMAALGFDAQPVPQGSQREPVWPAEIIGSISHCDGTAAAVLGQQQHFSGLGLDIERPEPLSADLIELICRPDDDAGTDGARAKLLFSIKEAIYKCIWPTVRNFVDFQEMQVVLGTNQFTAVPHSPHCPAGLVESLQGRFYVDDTWLLTSAWINRT